MRLAGIYLRYESGAHGKLLFANPHNAYAAYKIKQVRILVPMHLELATRGNTRKDCLYFSIQQRPAENTVGDLGAHGLPVHRTYVKHSAHTQTIPSDK